MKMDTLSLLVKRTTKSRERRYQKFRRANVHTRAGVSSSGVWYFEDKDRQRRVDLNILPPIAAGYPFRARDLCRESKSEHI